MDIPVLIYAGDSKAPAGDPRRGNQILLSRQSRHHHYGMYVEVPADLLSRAGLRLIDLMQRDLVGGPVSLGRPRLMTRRRRVGVARAAEVLSCPAHHAQILIDSYGEESVGEAIVCEDVDDVLYPRATSPAILAREINRLADRPGLIVRLPQQGEAIVNPAAARIDEEEQVRRWLPMLRRAAVSARYA